MNEEKWEILNGGNNRYLISNWGRLKSFAKKKEGLILSPNVSAQGYRTTTLVLHGEPKLALTHRLVAQTFIPNPLNLPCVNHKDGDKLNNHVDNLEWVTHSENTLHAYHKLKSMKGFKKGKENVRSNVIIQYDLDWNFIREWQTMKEICEAFNVYWGNISQCCLGKGNTAYGYRWKRKIDVLKNNNL